VISLGMSNFKFTGRTVARALVDGAEKVLTG
jgi:hypothetical protein